VRAGESNGVAVDVEVRDVVLGVVDGEGAAGAGAFFVVVEADSVKES